MQADSIPQHHSSVYSIVTEQILKQLESGVAPWHRPWTTELPKNLSSGRAYRGLNVFLLASNGYGSAYWLRNPDRWLDRNTRSRPSLRCYELDCLYGSVRARHQAPALAAFVHQGKSLARLTLAQLAGNFGADRRRGSPPILH